MLQCSACLKGIDAGVMDVSGKPLTHVLYCRPCWDKKENAKKIDKILCHLCLKEKESNEIVFAKAEIYACSTCYSGRNINVQP